MSEEQEPQATTSAKFDSKLDSWDANKAAHEAQQAREWEESLLRGTEVGTLTRTTPGVDDFSDEAQKRWEEAKAYNAYMEQFADQDGDAAERYQDAVDSGEVKDGIDRAIESSDKLRFMDSLARQIANLRESEPTLVDPDKKIQTARMIKDKEDQLQELLAKYRDDMPDERLAHGPTERRQVEMEGIKKEAIVDRIINHSSNTSPEEDETTGETPEGPESPEGDDDTPETPSGDTPETPDGSETPSGDTPEVPSGDTPDGKGGEGETPELPGDDTTELPDEKKSESRAEYDEELIARLEEALDKYAEVTAKDRTHVVGRFLSQDTRFNRFLKAIPPVRDIIDHLNDTDWAVEVQEAAEDYENALKECIAEFERISPDLSEQERQEAETRFLLDSDIDLEVKIAAKQKEESSPASRFSNWWVSQEGFKGNLKKAGAVLLIGGAAGGVAAGLSGALFGAAGVGIVGSIAGGLAGAATAQHVTSRRANSFVNGNVPEEEGVAYADAVAQQHLEFKQATMEDTMAEEADPLAAAGNMVKANEHITDLEVLRNRYRLRRALSLGALAGGLAGSLTGNLAGNITHPHPNTPASTGPSGGETNTPTPNHSAGTNPTPHTGGAEHAAGQAAEHAGKVYNYDYAAAPENLLRQVSPDQLGHNLSGKEAYTMLNKLVNSLGPDHVFNGIKLVEHSPGNWWIPNPGGQTMGLTKEAIEAASHL